METIFNDLSSRKNKDSINIKDNFINWKPKGFLAFVEDYCVINCISQVFTFVALDHQTYSALDQQTQITWTAWVKYDEQYKVGR